MKFLKKSMKNTALNQASVSTNHPHQSNQIFSRTAQFTGPPKSSPSIPLLTKLPKSKSSDQSWITIHQQFADYGRNAKEWIKKCQMLLPEIDKQKIWKKKGFSSIYVYAYQLAGMNENQVNESLRVLHRIGDKPALMKIFKEKGLQRVRPVAAIATIETQEFWAEKAKIMPKNSLEAYVQNYRREFLPREETQSANSQIDANVSTCANPQNPPFELQSATTLPHHLPSSQVTLAMQLDPKLADKLKKLKGQGDWNELMQKFIAMYEKEIEENKPKIVEVRAKQLQATHNTASASRPTGSRTIPAAIKHHVLAKTNSTCAFPGCTKPYEILHHTDRFAMYYTHDPNHIIPLCKAHERLAHLGLIENENQSPENWKIRTKPDYDDPKYEIDRVVEKYRQPKNKSLVPPLSA